MRWRCRSIASDDRSATRRLQNSEKLLESAKGSFISDELNEAKRALAPTKMKDDFQRS